MKRKKLIIGFSIYFGVLLVLYLGVASYFRNHFLPGSVINSMDCSSKTVAEVEEYIESDMEEYSLTLIERGGVKEVIQGSEIQFSYSSDGSIEVLQDKQNPLMWLPAYVFPHTYEMQANVSFDEILLRQKMNSLNCTQEDQMSQPKDAYLAHNGETFEIVEAEEGTVLDQEKFEQAVFDAVRTGKRELDLDESGCYQDYEFTADIEDLEKKRDALKRYEQVSVDYLIDNEELFLDTNTISQWLEIDENYQVSVNRDKVREYVRELGKKYDTWQTMGDFVTSYGETIQVARIGYGWSLDEESETDALIEIIEEGKHVERIPEYIKTANGNRENDIGDTYVEISYADQHMWFYIDGELIVSTDIVSGNPNKGMASPTGVFEIQGKERNATLRGEGYETPVAYWMPFDGAVGIHDATWQYAFGGDLYLTVGSHGCINTPLDLAGIIFENIEVGTAVVCY
ncbi:MAG: peptidoglycan binding domain-containing protein [Lachnospiraceae bacterium]|nr:L,D-transpeptidase/peptidoglycan binding protein [Robinsoniella sp.]MDY3767192.1 peptidoglycan binding domain-containing protein [Lachnospiraceae bacterium]